MDHNHKLKTIDSLNEVSADDWNRLVPDNHPFLQHAFLYGLEINDCTTASQGWQTRFFLAFDDHDKLIGALPCYSKHHSYGEYIFDWSWADAYQRAGLDYYPKLSSAIPFTPVTGPRLLLDDSLSIESKHKITSSFIQTIVQDAQNTQQSSIHILFNEEKLASHFERYNFVLRKSTQFHWLNRYDPEPGQQELEADVIQFETNYQKYVDFDSFLSSLNSRKRKNVKRERKRVTDAEVEYQWFTGSKLTKNVMDVMFRFYKRTLSRYNAQQYLSRSFFEYLVDAMPESTLVLLAFYKGKPIAGSLFFRDESTLYGRYWGAEDNYDSLHFETCYYQAIEYCIKHGLERFEAGAQGEHKLSRGLTPQTTYSLHYMIDRRFDSAVRRYVFDESEHIEKYQAELNANSPYRKG